MKYIIEFELKKEDEPVYFTDAYIDDAREVDYAIQKLAQRLTKADTVVIYLSNKNSLVDIKEIPITINIREEVRSITEDFRELTRKGKDEN